MKSLLLLLLFVTAAMGDNAPEWRSEQATNSGKAFSWQKQQSPQDYFLSMSANTVAAASRLCTGGVINGQRVILPAGSGFYPYAYVRDTAMTVRGCPSAFSASDLENFVTLFLSQVRGDGGIYDGISPDGSTLAPAGSGVAGWSYDNPFELLSLVYNHFKLTGTASLYSANKTAVLAAINSVPVVNHLIYVDPAFSWPSTGPWGIFGFQDSVVAHGSECMTSLYRYRAYRELAELSVAVGDSDIYSAELPNITTAIEATFWDSGVGLLRNSTLSNTTQHAVCASAYGVCIGALSGSVADAISQTFIDAMHGGSREALGIFQSGGARNMPQPELWDAGSYNDVFSTGPGGYQNGGFWSTFTGWVARAMARKNYNAGFQLITELLRGDQAQVDADRPLEAFNRDIGYKGAQIYCTSAALPLQFWQPTFDE